jgi:hypothetical protein
LDLDKRRAKWDADRRGVKLWRATLNKRDLTFIRNEKKQADVMVLPLCVTDISEVLDDFTVRTVSDAEMVEAWDERQRHHRCNRPAEPDDEEMMRRFLKVGFGFEATTEKTIGQIKGMIRRLRNAGFRARPDTLEKALEKVVREWNDEQR